MLAAGLIFRGCLALAAQDGSIPAKPKPRSLLVVTFDTTRRDFMGFLGRKPSPTPSLDRLSERAVVFTDANTVAPITLPAHSSLMTGLYPRSHGVYDNTLFKLPASAVTLAEILRERGYATGAAVASFVLDPMFGIDQGFDFYSAPPPQPATAESFLSERRADEMEQRALADLAKLSQHAPFFYWVHFFDPHFPYSAPTTRPPTSDEVAEPNGLVRHVYSEEIRFADAHLGRVLDALAQRGLLDDLVVLFAADHGESLGDTPESSHGFFVFDPTIRIPMLLKHPDLKPRRTDLQVSLVDVVPTLLDLLGVSAPERRFDGIDLAPLLRDESREPPDRALLIGAWTTWVDYGWAPFDGFLQGSLKFVRSHRVELFDRASDPRETTNLFRADDPRSIALSKRLDVLFGSLAAKLEREPVSLNEEERKSLERLGYVAGSAPVGDVAGSAELPDAYDKIAILKCCDDVTLARAENRLADAIEIQKKLVLAEPQSARLKEELGTMLYDLGPEHVDESEQYLLASLKIDARRSRSHYALALIAVARARQAHARSKELRDRGDAEEARTSAREERKQIRHAQRAFRTCLEFEPNFRDGIENYARFQLDESERALRSGEKEDARKGFEEVDALLERFLKLTPAGTRESEDARVARGRCKAHLDELRAAKGER